jgi:hypothetical protein
MLVRGGQSDSSEMKIMNQKSVNEKPIVVDAAKGFPPWGFMLPDLLSENNPPWIPKDFRLRTCEDPKNRQQIWVDWRTATLERIKDVLWPEYKPATNTWEGPSAAGTRMLDLTNTDLDLLARIQAHPAGLEFERPPRSPLRTPDCPVQAKLFQLEDTEQYAESYQHYDGSLFKVMTTDVFSEVRDQGMLRKVASVSIQFKVFFQRPRAYQMAMLLGRPSDIYFFAQSADTPSLSSGHCLQGMLAVGGIIERFLIDGTLDKLDCASKSLFALQQWAVDLGDRRVLAGVHYPSDNLASWLIFLRLADRVYFHPDVKKKLWEAVRKQSYIYREIQLAAGTDKNHPYRPALDELDQAALLQPPADLVQDPGLLG